MSLGEESWGPLYWALQTLMLVVSQISGIGAVVVAGEGLDHQFQEKKKAYLAQREIPVSNTFHKDIISLGNTRHKVHFVFNYICTVH